MTPLSTFVLVGTIISTDSFLTTLEFDLNPATNGQPAIAVLPRSAIPCDVIVGGKVYVVKSEVQETPTITCEKAKDD